MACGNPCDGMLANFFITFRALPGPDDSAWGDGMYPVQHRVSLKERWSQSNSAVIRKRHALAENRHFPPREERGSTVIGLGVKGRQDMRAVVQHGTDTGRDYTACC